MNKDKKPNNANNSANMRLVELSIRQNLLLWQISQSFVALDKQLSDTFRKEKGGREELR